MFVPPSDRGSRRPDARRAALTEAAERVGGVVVEGKMTGGYEVQLEHEGWTLHLGLHAAHNASDGMIHTRVLVRFRGRDDCKLLVRRRSAIDRLVAGLGLGGLRAGGRELQERYVVRGRPVTRVRSVLSGGLAESILDTDAHRVEVRRDSWLGRRKRGRHARTLQVLEPGTITDPDRLVLMVTVAREALDALRRVGLATPGLASQDRSD